MRQAHLKILRVLLALLFFIATGFLFLDFREVLNTKVFQWVTLVQFLPSVLDFFTTFGLLSAGFLLVLLLTSLFGRVYCSAICPLGILQDFISRIRRMTKKKVHRYRYGKPHHSWRYGFLAAPVLILLGGRSLAGINLLDPYSIFGRIFSDLALPAVLWTNNRLGGILETANLYFLYRVDILPSGLAAYLVAALMLGIIFWFSFTRGRLYCNTVCPVGTLLGLLSRISVFRIMMLESRCTKCAKCAFACKASCIDVKNLEVDFSRCVACFNCLDVCPEDAILYLSAGSRESIRVRPVEGTPDPMPQAVKDAVVPVGPSSRGRRDALTRLLVAVLSLVGMTSRAIAGTRFMAQVAGARQEDRQGKGTFPEGGSAKDTLGQSSTRTVAAKVENKIPTEIEPLKHFPVSPPGSLGIRHLTTRCTACHLCVSVCPTRVLRPSLNEYGLDGMLQVHMDYSTNYCNYECVRCSEVCPTGAILPVDQEQKKTLQLGQVHLILENCVVYAENTACGSCSEHCPTQAVTMVPFRGGLTLPEIKPAICVGCGACEYACPVRPHKAIYVDGHEIHQVAEKPEVEEIESTEIEDFPF